MMNSKLLKLARMVMNLAEIKTNKGELISETVIEVGSEVFIEDANDMLVPAPDGEYVTQDEVTIVVADGKVVEIREKEPVEEQPVEEQPKQPVEEPLAEEPAEEQPTEEAPTEDDKDAEIAKLQAQIDELNSIIAEKDEEIGKLKAELEKSDSKPAEEQLKSQKTVKPIWKPRF